ncbi:hypothetical protein [Pseudomonas pergaminensis]|uniref:hypothetical protein n=1 Tax=Pseudomonas pergaminensis TaxID=2853159 RepID=UPI0034D4CDBC
MIFAQIVSGKVASVFTCDQDPNDWPGVVELQEDDPLYVSFLASMASIEIVSKLSYLTSQANAQVSALNGRIDTLSFAISGNDASKTEVDELPVRIDQLKEWRQYNLDLSRVPAQASWPHSAQWPDQPDIYS